MRRTRAIRRVTATVAVGVVVALTVGAAPAAADHNAAVTGPEPGVFDRCAHGEIDNPVGVPLLTDEVVARVDRHGALKSFTCFFDIPRFVPDEERFDAFDGDWVLPRRATTYNAYCERYGSQGQSPHVVNGTLRITPSGRGILTCDFVRGTEP